MPRALLSIVHAVLRRFVLRTLRTVLLRLDGRLLGPDLLVCVAGEWKHTRVSAAAQRTHMHNRSREERERSAIYATLQCAHQWRISGAVEVALRARWKIAHTDKEARSLECAHQWRISGA